MASASLGNGGVGSSRSVNGFKSSSSSVDWLGREMLEMRLRDKVDHDEDRVRILHVLLVGILAQSWLLLAVGIFVVDIHSWAHFL